MNKTKQSAPFYAKLKPSKQLKYLNIAIHLTAWIACFANALPLFFQVIIAVLIGVDFWFNARNLAAEPGALSHSDDKGWQLFVHEKFEKLLIKQSTVISTFLIVLHPAKRPAILVARDALSEDDFRQLIVKLKLTVQNETNPD